MISLQNGIIISNLQIKRSAVVKIYLNFNYLHSLKPNWRKK